MYGIVALYDNLALATDKDVNAYLVAHISYGRHIDYAVLDGGLAPLAAQGSRVGTLRRRTLLHPRELLARLVDL